MGVTSTGGKGGAPTVYGQSSLSNSGQQPDFGSPNRYANSVGMSQWDNASLYPRAQSNSMGSAKGGKVKPSGVGYPSQGSGKGGPVAQVVQQTEQKPTIDSPIKNVQANSANALYASRGATGDPEGMKYWQGRYAAGEDPAQIQRDFNASFDYVKSQQKVG